jgi:hypothetical protein
MDASKLFNFTMGAEDSGACSDSNGSNGHGRNHLDRLRPWFSLAPNINGIADAKHQSRVII